MDFLPLSEPVLLVLLSLAEQPRHGYSILQDVERMSDGRVVLSTGTLYGALQRLLRQGWIDISIIIEMLILCQAENDTACPD